VVSLCGQVAAAGRTDSRRQRLTSPRLAVGVPSPYPPTFRRKLEAKQAFGGNGPVLVVFGCNRGAAGGRAGIRMLLRTIFERIMVVKTGASAPFSAMFDGTYAMLLLSQYKDAIQVRT
jgi:hypothetical protein